MIQYTSTPINLFNVRCHIVVTSDRSKELIRNVHSSKWKSHFARIQYDFKVVLKSVDEIQLK